MSNTLPEYPLYNNGKDLNPNHLITLDNTIQDMLDDHTRVFALRVDLHVPDCELINRCKLMSRFIGSLKAQLKASEGKRSKQGTRIYPNTLRYVWGKEYGAKNELEHYHVLLLFNKDAYYKAGNYRTDSSLKNKINKAWISALGDAVSETASHVHLPVRGGYYIDGNSADYKKQLDEVMYRASYFCKNETKVISASRRSFGSSPRIVRKRAFS
ncbi:Putative uncharacterized protein [Moritella viscosa]|uniref:inovirus Gp2 family protein n=1 Tax=Moritella viscosa TaxID=80854 RepID=UPI000922165B|nr:inovirus Gp2 family protein [Moritella viscosa]SGZ08030.1 Putative uncharacterized protein [Moritella viscosa]